MLPKKTPTSSLSGSRAHVSQPSPHLTVTITAAIELLVNRIWYRNIARTLGTSSGGTPSGTCVTRPSPAMRLPQELIQIIIAHLIYDLHSLCSCSLTCYSWYIAAAPHLYPTLITFMNCSPPRTLWPYPISNMHKLGLLPFVKTLKVDRRPPAGPDFSPERFNWRILHQFSALTNVQRLEIRSLDIPSFIPRIRPYFGSFLPSVRHLNLNEPIGSNRQIIFFIGLFQHLQNLTLTGKGRAGAEEDLTITPTAVPPLQGQLEVWNWTKVDFFRDMVDMFGEIRFETVSLFDVDETRFILRSCAQTLRKLQLYPNDCRGERMRPQCQRFPRPTIS